MKLGDGSFTAQRIALFDPTADLTICCNNSCGSYMSNCESQAPVVRVYDYKEEHRGITIVNAGRSPYLAEFHNRFFITRSKGGVILDVSEVIAHELSGHVGPAFLGVGELLRLAKSKQQPAKFIRLALQWLSELLAVAKSPCAAPGRKLAVATRGRIAGTTLRYF